MYSLNFREEEEGDSPALSLLRRLIAEATKEKSEKQNKIFNLSSTATYKGTQSGSCMR